MNYHRVCKTRVTRRVPLEKKELITLPDNPRCLVVRVAPSLVFWVVFCRPSSVLFLLVNVLSVLLITPFNIFKLFLLYFHISNSCLKTCARWFLQCNDFLNAILRRQVPCVKLNQFTLENGIVSLWSFSCYLFLMCHWYWFFYTACDILNRTCTF